MEDIEAVPFMDGMIYYGDSMYWFCYIVDRGDDQRYMQQIDAGVVYLLAIAFLF